MRVLKKTEAILLIASATIGVVLLDQSLLRGLSADVLPVRGPTYKINSNSGGEVRHPTTFTVSFGTGVVTGVVRMTPRASNGDGSFSPASIDLTNTTRSGAFTYTPTVVGWRSIIVGNDGGIVEASANFNGLMQLGKTKVLPNPENNGGVPPTEQSLTPDLGGYIPFLTGPLAAYMQPIDTAPIDPRSDKLMAMYQSGAALESRRLYTEGLFGQQYMESGMPFNVVAGTQPMVSVTYDNPNEAYPNESDPGPMPIPPDAVAQAYLGTPTTPPQSDGHVVVIDRDNKKLYELYKAYKDPTTNAWHAGAGAVWDLERGGGGYYGTGPARVTQGQLRPLGWTSADAAGLPIFPFLVRYDEVARGSIPHALRATFSVGRVAGRYVFPARHYAGGARAWDETTFPYGARLRLKADWYEAHKNTFGPQARVIIDAMRTYGIFNSDIGFDFSLAGVADSRWNYTTDLVGLRSVPASAFEVVAMPDDFSVTASAKNVLVGTTVGINVSYTMKPGENVDHIETYITDDLSRGACISCGSVNLTAANPSGTFSYTPTTPGRKQIDLIDFPAGMMYTPAVVTALSPGTDYIFTGPPGIPIGLIDYPSPPYTVAFRSGQATALPVTVTPNDSGAGGTFVPSSLQLSLNQTGATFHYIPAHSGSITLRVTNNGGLTNPGPLIYNVADTSGSVSGFVIRHDAGSSRKLTWSANVLHTVLIAAIDSMVFGKSITSEPITPTTTLPSGMSLTPHSYSIGTMRGLLYVLRWQPASGTAPQSIVLSKIGGDLLSLLFTVTP